MTSDSVSVRGMVYASLFGAATAAGAYIIIPLPPVPITLQTLFLCLAGTLLGAKLGALSQVVYILLGVIGLPVFAGGKAGLGVLFGPTGGYLFGFIAGAYVVGRIVEQLKNPGWIPLALSMVAGFLVVYLLGVVQLSLVANLSIKKAVVVGALPFLIGDALKIAAAVFITLKLRSRIRL